MNSKLPEFLVSSNGYGLALRWKSMLVVLIPLALMVAQYFNLPLTEGNINEWLEAGTIIVAIVMYFVGQFRAWENKRLGRGKYAK